MYVIQLCVFYSVSIAFHLQVSFPDVEKVEWLNKVCSLSPLSVLPVGSYVLSTC